MQLASFDFGAGHFLSVLNPLNLESSIRPFEIEKLLRTNIIGQLCRLNGFVRATSSNQARDVFQIAFLFITPAQNLQKWGLNSAQNLINRNDSEVFRSLNSLLIEMIRKFFAV